MKARESRYCRAKMVQVTSQRGKKSNVLLLQYLPGAQAAYVLVTQEDGSHGPLEFSTFGNDLSQQRVRKAWRDWERSPDVDHKADFDEWTPRVAVEAFVHWLNSGGEARLAATRARRAR